MKKVGTNLFLHVKPGSKWDSYSYLLKRVDGNFLIACGDVTECLEEVEEQGKLTHIFLTDIHFANKWHGEVANHFGATLVCHEIDRDKVKAKTKARAIACMGARDEVAKDFWSMHTPGHADGGLCFGWRNGKTVAVFTGDFLCRNRGQWVVFTSKSKHKVMSRSLTELAEVPANMICPGIGDASSPPCSQLKAKELAGICQGVQSQLQ